MLSLMAFVRIFVLSRRVEWRNNLEEFPTACGDWAAQCGCTRLTLAKEGCVRTGDLATTSTIVLDVGSDDELLNQRIVKCTHNISGAKLHSPSGLRHESNPVGLIHVTFQSTFMGFIDDMFMQTYILSDPIGVSNSRVVDIQS